jgi:hypothetical protein
MNVSATSMCIAGEIKLLQNPFHFNTEEQPPELPIELLLFTAMMY